MRFFLSEAANRSDSATAISSGIVTITNSWIPASWKKPLDLLGVVGRRFEPWYTRRADTLCWKTPRP